MERHHFRQFVFVCSLASSSLLIGTARAESGLGADAQLPAPCEIKVSYGSNTNGDGGFEGIVTVNLIAWSVTKDGVKSAVVDSFAKNIPSVETCGTTKVVKACAVALEGALALANARWLEMKQIGVCRMSRLN